MLHEVSEIELDGEGEEEIEVDEEDLEYDEQEYEEEAFAVDGDGTYRPSLSPGVNSTPNSNGTDHSESARTSRKRSSDELDGEDEDGSSASTYGSGDSVRSRRPDGTPPKRARLADKVTDAAHRSASFIGPVLPLTQNMTSATGADDTPEPVATPTPTIKRAKKRSSEELTMDDDGNAGDGAGIVTGIPTVSSKRAKVDLERPRSLSLAPHSKPGAAVATIDRNPQRTIALGDK